MKHDEGLPGSTALLASPQVKDLHLEVTIKRSATPSAEHFTNIILRMDPKKLNGSFYRVQIRESCAADNDELSVSIYKIVDPNAEDGINITPSAPSVQGFDVARKKDLRVVVDLEDKGGTPTFNIVLWEAGTNCKILQLLCLQDTDTTAPPLTHAGWAGLSHYMGETFFDDFSLQKTALPVPDGGVPDAAGDASPDALLQDAAVPDITLIPPLIMIDNDPSSTHGFATTKPGTAITFTAVHTCPVASCIYAWDFGNSTTGSGKTLTAVTYSQTGLYHVTLTVTDTQSAVLGQATGVITVWTGQITDDFNRALVDWDQHFWLKPLNSAALFDIQSNWLHVQHNLGLPGSSAIINAALVQDVHVEVTVKRSQITTVEHYTDVIVRMHPQKLNGSFYRVRVKESTAANSNELDLSVFKIISSQDEHGIDITGTPQVLTNFDPTRQKDILVTIDVKNDTQGIPVFDVTFAEAASPTTVLVQVKGLKDTDTTAPPHAYAGFTGLTQFSGDTYFDSFLVKSQ